MFCGLALQEVFLGVNGISSLATKTAATDAAIGMGMGKGEFSGCECCTQSVLKCGALKPFYAIGEYTPSYVCTASQPGTAADC
jgi:hypothetical protein